MSSSSSSSLAAKKCSVSSSEASFTYLGNNHKSCVGDDFGLRGLARSLEVTTQLQQPQQHPSGLLPLPGQGGTAPGGSSGGPSSAGTTTTTGSSLEFTIQDLGVTEEMLYNQAPLHVNLESVLSNPGFRTPMSEYEGR